MKVRQLQTALLMLPPSLTVGKLIEALQNMNEQLTIKEVMDYLTQLPLDQEILDAEGNKLP